MRPQSTMKQSGFTLLETLVAMAVTLVIVGAAIWALRDSVRSNQDVAYRTDMNDNLRAGLNMIEQDLIQAGTGIPTGGIPIPNTPNSSNSCNTTAAPNRPTLTGTLTFPQCNFVLPAVEPGSALGPLITSPDAVAGNPASSSSYTDIITILYADNSTSAGMDNSPIYSVDASNNVICNGTISSTGDSVKFDSATGCADLGTAGIQIQVGDLIMFSNTLGNVIQTVTAVSGQTLTFATGDPFNLNGRTDPQGTIKQIQNTGCTSSSTTAACYPPTTATRIWMISYYLDNITDPSHVRLVRRVNFNDGQPIGETLENMQFTYNFVDGSTNPANQTTVPSGFSESEIRAVNVFLGARSNYSDMQQSRYIRSNLQTQVSLRSMAYRSRYN